MREVAVLRLLHENRARVGHTVERFFRQLLLEPIPDRALTVSRRRRGDPVYLRSIAEYAALEGCSLRHMQTECRRLGLSPSYLRDRILLKTLLEVRLVTNTLRAVARRVGFSSETAASRFLKRVGGAPDSLLAEEASLKVLAELARALGLVEGRQESASKEG